MSRLQLLAFSVTTFVLTSQSQAQIVNGKPSPAKVVYADDFGDVKGFYTTNKNDNYTDGPGTRTRDAHTFMGGAKNDGDLVVTIREDNESKGADKKPGVLALCYDEVSANTQYSGFVYQGRVDKPIQLPRMADEVTERELKQVTLSFRYRATNKRDETRASMNVNCRVEVNLDEPYEHRLDLGTLKAFDRWEAFETRLSVGTNRYKFLEAINQTQDPTFKIVWGQESEITNYDPGDTLLIDDLKITVSKP